MNGLNFGHKVEEKSSGDPIPKDTLVWCVLAIRSIKNSRETNGRYLDIELTVLDNQPFARRKIWDKIADPFDGNNSEEWRNMGYMSIRRILEAVKGANPADGNSYSLNRLEDLHGLTVPVLVGIEKGKDGYEDKNRAEYLSPHSTVKKIVECHRLLSSGVFQYGKTDKPAGVPPQGNMFTGNAQPAPAGFQPPAAAPASPPASSAPGWLAPAQNAPAAPAAAPVTQPAQQPYQAPQQAPVAQPTGFPQGMTPAQPQQGQFTAPANPAVPPQSGTMNTAPAAAPAGQFPSNQGWTAPQAGMPAQFPQGNQ